MFLGVKRRKLWHVQEIPYGTVYMINHLNNNRQPKISQGLARKCIRYDKEA
jgi:hypothetical protein